MYLDGRGLRHRDSRGETIVDDSFLLVLHSGDDPGSFRLPGRPWAGEYEIVVDTGNPGGRPDPAAQAPAGGADFAVGARTAFLLRVRRAGAVPRTQ
jgi:glycogen operon protein